MDFIKIYRINLEVMTQLKLLQMSVKWKGKVDQKDVEKLAKLIEKHQEVFDEIEKAHTTPMNQKYVDTALANFNALKDGVKNLREVMQAEQTKK